MKTYATSEGPFTNRETEVYVANACSYVCVCVCVRARVRYDINDEWKGGFKQLAIKAFFMRSLNPNKCVALGEMLAGTVGITKYVDQNVHWYMSRDRIT